MAIAAMYCVHVLNRSILLGFPSQVQPLASCGRTKWHVTKTQHQGYSIHKYEAEDGQYREDQVTAITKKGRVR